MGLHYNRSRNFPDLCGRTVEMGAIECDSNQREKPAELDWRYGVSTLICTMEPGRLQTRLAGPMADFIGQIQLPC